MKDKIKINTQYETQSNTLKKQPIPNPFTNKSGDGTKKVIMSLELVCMITFLNNQIRFSKRIKIKMKKQSQIYYVYSRKVV